MNKSSNITKLISKYIIIVFIMTAFVAVDVVIVYSKTKEGEKTAQIVNAAGRQRMLIQEMAKQILLLNQSETPPEGSKHLDAFESSLKLFSSTHNSLLRGGGIESFPIENNQKILAILSDQGQKLDKSVRQFIIDATNFIILTKNEGPKDKRLIKAMLDAAAITKGSISEGLDKVVDQLQLNSEKRAQTLAEYLIISTTIGLLLLALMSLVVLWPAMKKLDKNEKKIQDHFQELNHVKQILLSAQQLANVGSWELYHGNKELICSPQIQCIFEDDISDFSTNYKKYLSAIMPEDRAMIHQSNKEGLQTKRTLDQQYRIVMKDGRVKHVKAHVRSIYDVANKPIKTIGAIQDITEQVIAQTEMESSLRQTIEALADTLEVRDNYTAGHSHNVAKFSEEIAIELGLSQDRINGLTLASMVHDIGKIQVPMEILEKSGRLSEEEFEMIKQHPQIGYDILKELKFKQPVAQIVYQHHERMDGTGYPNGLVGEEILLESRILAAADTLEAMACDRPYRKALGIEKALEVIKQGSGISYDAQVVSACLYLYGKRIHTQAA